MIALTGATGAIGGRVAARLAAGGTPIRLLVRDAARVPSLPRTTGVDVTVVGGYDDTDALVAGLAGVEALLLVSAGEAPDRVGLHASVIEAAVAAGVSRVVYTSFLGAAPECTFTFGRDHWHTEQLLLASGMATTFLRDSLYLDFMPALAAPEDSAPDDSAPEDPAPGDSPRRESGGRVIRGPGGTGRFAPVSRDDVADVAAAVLRDASGASDGAFDLTGPVALTFADVARELSAATGAPVRYEDETIEAAWASRASYGAPDWAVAGWISSYTAIAAGELDVVSDAVEQLAGHPATSVPQWLAAHPEALG